MTRPDIDSDRIDPGNFPRGDRSSRGPGQSGVGLSLLLLFAIGGCGGSGRYSGALYPTTGQVLLAGGKPLAGGSVQFIPTQGGLPATGKIGPDGTFALMTKTREGAAPGEYKVRIEPIAELLTKKGGAEKRLPFALKYRNYDGDTGLTATIGAETTQLKPFILDVK